MYIDFVVYNFSEKMTCFAFYRVLRMQVSTCQSTRFKRRWLRFIYSLLIDWLIDYLLFYVPLKNISLIWRRHHYRWRTAKFRPMLGAQGLWAGRDLFRFTPAVTRGLGFSGLIRRTALFSQLLRHTKGCGGSILPRILTGPLLVAFYDTQGDVEDLF